MRRVVAEDVPDTRTVQGRGSRLDDVEVDVDGLGHRPSQVAHEPALADPGALAEGRVHGHGGGELEEGQLLRPGEVLGHVDGLAAAQADDRAHLRQPRRSVIECLHIEGVHEVRGSEAVLQPGLEARPQVRHGHHEEGPMREGGHLVASDPAPVDGGEPEARDHRTPLSLTEPSSRRPRRAWCR